MGKYGDPCPATGFAFNVLNLLQIFENTCCENIDKIYSFLIFNLLEDKRPALALAAALRKQGYPVARDIIRRDLAESLKYSKLNGIEYAVVIGEPGFAEDELLLVRAADGMRRTVKTDDLFADATLVLK